jgi:hypothetical protein
LPTLGERGGIGPLDVQPLLPLVVEKGIDLAWKRGQLAPGEVERAVACGPEKGPVVRHDQAGLAILAQEVLEEDLRAQVEEIRRLVEQEQCRLVQEEGGELGPRLPSAREGLDRPRERLPLDLEAAGDFAAFPLRLSAVTDEKCERGLAGEEGIVLSKVAEPKPRMTDDLAGIELLFAKNHAQQRALPGAVAADEAGLPVVGDRGRCIVEQHLVAIALRGVLDVEQDGHG